MVVYCCVLAVGAKQGLMKPVKVWVMCSFIQQCSGEVRWGRVGVYHGLFCLGEVSLGMGMNSIARLTFAIWLYATVMSG